MAKKTEEAEHGLKDVAVAVGTALGKLAHKLGLGETPASPVPEPPVKVATRKPPAPKKRIAAKKKVAAKKAVAKGTGPKRSRPSNKSPEV
jgi:hypothetical protein